MKIPGTITAGDTVTWRDDATTDNLGNVIDSTWTLTWTFSGLVAFSVASSASSTGWQTQLSAAQTASLYNGDDTVAYWQATASKAGQTFTIGTGTLKVRPNLATMGAGYDGRSQAEKDLAAVQTAIRARISGGVVAEYTIGSRRLRNEPTSELLALESRLKLIVSKERQAQSIANGLGDPRNTFVRFG